MDTLDPFRHSEMHRALAFARARETYPGISADLLLELCDAAWQRSAGDPLDGGALERFERALDVVARSYRVGGGRLSVKEVAEDAIPLAVLQPYIDAQRRRPAPVEPQPLPVPVRTGLAEKLAKIPMLSPAPVGAAMAAGLIGVAILGKSGTLPVVPLQPSGSEDDDTAASTRSESRAAKPREASPGAVLTPGPLTRADQPQRLYDPVADAVDSVAATVEHRADQAATAAARGAELAEAPRVAAAQGAPDGPASVTESQAANRPALEVSTPKAEPPPVADGGDDGARVPAIPHPPVEVKLGGHDVEGGGQDTDQKDEQPAGEKIEEPVAPADQKVEPPAGVNVPAPVAAQPSEPAPVAVPPQPEATTTEVQEPPTPEEPAQEAPAPEAAQEPAAQGEQQPAEQASAPEEGQEPEEPAAEEEQKAEEHVDQPAAEEEHRPEQPAAEEEQKADEYAERPAQAQQQEPEPEPQQAEPPDASEVAPAVGAVPTPSAQP